MNTVAIVAAVVIGYLILAKPANVASYSSGPLGTRVTVPGIGTYSTTPWGTSVQLAAELANPIAALFGAKQPSVGAAPLSDSMQPNPGTVFSPYDPNLASGGDPSPGLLTESGPLDPTTIYGGNPSTIGAGTNGLTPADLVPVDLSSGVVPA